ncbi:methionine--tRNA ligase, cytoplasmic isoform X1 [Beta vulgaris subsp. vulgaris]|uniref:methionine--tRNA ligase, cytoplasmic isoform X1 n=1 Tax=Beta vulgaris subsp. vulgaris TaxID=3555 RepID=UPI002036D869|nr:methionine--tRNA ligase, cytoplasmic isoform X1 [Beta vulgaris subsp. vulgaris]
MSQLDEKVPISGKRNMIVTSALPYVNNVPHLGNIVGSVLSADIFARFCRLRGYNVLFVCGTDEYGTTTEVRAAMDNLTPREICDKYHPLHKDIYDWFDIQFDQFGRTSTPEHTVVCHQVLNSLNTNNCLQENILEQLYCEQCSKFLADSLVEGQCPRCLKSCKGDQCESCGAFVNARELLNPVCKICRSSSLSLRTSEHLFLQLASLKQDLHALSDRVTFSNQQAVTDTQKLLHKELQPKCITRDLEWGVPVPFPAEKFRKKVMYVWFDAPLGYISITKCHTSKWELWWKNPQNVELHCFMGKDNVPFHSVYFPSYLIGTGEKWTLPHSIHATHFLLYGAGKFSKSNGIGVFGDDAKKTNIPVEVWRYYLTSVRPETSDSRFSWEDLQAKLNSELADNLGNFMNRVLTFVAKPSGKGYNSVIPDVSDVVPSEMDAEFIEYLLRYVQEYVKALEKGKLKDGLKAAMAIANEGNRLFQRTEVWKLYVEDRSRCSFIVKTLVGVVCILACLLQPFMPSFSTEVLKQLRLEAHELTLHDDDIERVQRPWELVPAGHKIGKPRPLFRKLSQNDVNKLEREFSGIQNGGIQNDRFENVKLLNKSKFEGVSKVGKDDGN